jgi:hypothetical protein
MPIRAVAWVLTQLVNDIRSLDGNANKHWLAAQREVLNVALSTFACVSVTLRSRLKPRSVGANLASKLGRSIDSKTPAGGTADGGLAGLQGAPGRQHS